MANLLLTKGADPKLRSKEGVDARALAIKKGHDDMVSLLDKYL